MPTDDKSNPMGSTTSSTGSTPASAPAKRSRKSGAQEVRSQERGEVREEERHQALGREEGRQEGGQEDHAEDGREEDAAKKTAPRKPRARSRPRRRAKKSPRSAQSCGAKKSACPFVGPRRRQEGLPEEEPAQHAARRGGFEQDVLDQALEQAGLEEGEVKAVFSAPARMGRGLVPPAQGPTKNARRSAGRLSFRGQAGAQVPLLMDRISPQ